MSLLGSEVDISDDIDLQQSCSDSSRSPLSSHPCTKRSLSPLRSFDYDDDVHPPVSPPGSPEQLFLAELPTQTISAAALAQQIHQRHRPLSLAATSVATDDFQSAVEVEESNLSILSDSPFGKDALFFSREPPILEQPEFQESMEDMHVDAAEKVYDNVKGVWAWGKGVPVFSPFMGLAEGVAGKVVSMAGSNLEEVDGCLTQNLHGLDDNVLNPAIKAVVETIMGAVGKSEDFVKPIVITVLKPFGLIKENGEQPAGKVNSAPEVTYASRVATK